MSQDPPHDPTAVIGGSYGADATRPECPRISLKEIKTEIATSARTVTSAASSVRKSLANADNNFHIERYLITTSKKMGVF